MAIELSKQDDQIYWKLYYKDDVNADIHRYGIENGMFKAACAGGHLQLAKYLLDTSKQYAATIDFNDNCAFIAACQNGKLHIIKFLIDYKQGERKIDLYAQNDFGFSEALVNQKYKVVEFLLSCNPLLTQEEKQYQEKRFILLCKKNELDLIKFCINDLGQQKTEYITQQLESMKSMKSKSQYESFITTVENLFSMKELNNNLTNKFANKEFKEMNKNKI